MQRFLLVARIALLLVSAGAQLRLFWLIWQAGAAPDFRSFMIAGEAANQGLDPYVNYPQLIKVTGMGHTWAYPNLNPPVSVLPMQLLASVDYGVARTLWAGGSALLYVGTVLGLARHYAAPGTRWRVAGMLLLDGFWSAMSLGQLYMLLLVPTALAVLLGERRPGWSGFWLGALIAIKPQFLLWSLLLGGARHWRIALVSVATAAGIGITPLFFGHADWYPDWISGIRANSILTQFPNNVSLVSLLQRLGFPMELALATAVAFATAVALLVVWRRPAPATIAGLAVSTVILASPISWTGYSVFLVPVLLAAGRWSRPLVAGLHVLIVPGILLWQTTGSFVVYTLGLACCLGAFAREAWQGDRAGAQGRVLEKQAEPGYSVASIHS